MRVFVSKKSYKKVLQKRIGGSDKRQDGKREKRRTNGARSAPNLRRATARGARQGYIVPKSECKKTYKKRCVFSKRLTKKTYEKRLTKNPAFCKLTK